MNNPTIPILDPSSLRGGVPRLVPRHDLHLHTDFTDGKSTVDDYVKRALELKLEHIGFPEHCNLKTTWRERFVPVIEEARKAVAGKGLTIHWGIEAKGMDYEGRIAASDEMLGAAEYVYGAFHSSLTKTPFPELQKEEAAEMEFKVIAGLLRKRSCHVIAHPGGLSLKYQHGYFPNSLYEDLAKIAGENDVALELNSGYGADLNHQIDTCIKYGVKITLGSNAHAVAELGEIVTALQ